MTVFILVLFFVGRGGVTTINTPYRSLEACQEAGQQANKASGDWLRFTCVQSDKLL